MRILVVDDEPAVCSSIDRLLTEEGHVVVSTMNAFEAVELLRTQDFDLALIDYKLHAPLTGVDVGKQAKRGTALVMISGYSPDEMRPRIEDPLRGFLAVIGKPPSKKELLTIVAQVENSLEGTRP